MRKRIIKFGVIGCGLMGREFASAVNRWCHLLNLDFSPQIIGVCDTNSNATSWFEENIPSLKLVTDDYHELLTDPEIEAIYCAVPHHLHEQFYMDIINSKKHLLGEKPFGIDLKANQKILDVIERHPDVVVRGSSEFPFFPGVQLLSKWIQEDKFGKILNVEAGFLHSSDLDPNKKINWKRKIEFNGEYGCMGDLGLHVLHMPLRFGWIPKNVRAILSNIVTKRPNEDGFMEDCETWDNATLLCEVEKGTNSFPMLLNMKRIAPGHANSWYLNIHGTDFSCEYSTKHPKQIHYMEYHPSGNQSWQTMDVPYQSAYESITGPIFEFGFSDSILQMWAAFVDEIANRDRMAQSFTCASPTEIGLSHQIFTAALRSQQTGETVTLTQQRETSWIG
ncbi:Gfo/Idh/MocA family protein [Bacillus sp. Marseille-Q3570]|uniref:Gfo/Idh/MocA family protein n=1 Tax=Bacillus sp. Marseille-Q3570 TaxID=2963522 RepID=UPI0021B6EFD3|nr:Gfo/Idh/MocA family oxidoreductase [Bacillus sp. Marseille-Q3570]